MDGIPSWVTTTERLAGIPASRFVQRLHNTPQVFCAANSYIFVERLWRSVKYEDVYLKGYATMSDLLLGLTEYIVFYNRERAHQSLDYDIPDQVCRTASGGGAKIVDKYYEKRLSGHPSETEKTHSEIETKKQNARAAMFRCMKMVTLLNSMHYCLDRGVHYTSMFGADSATSSA